VSIISSAIEPLLRISSSLRSDSTTLASSCTTSTRITSPSGAALARWLRRASARRVAVLAGSLGGEVAIVAGASRRAHGCSTR
jgi:hypothetical protein